MSEGFNKPFIDMCHDTAEYLSARGLGVYEPHGVNGNIFVEVTPLQPLIKLCLFQQGGLDRELAYRGDIRRPLLHIEYTDATRLKVKQKLALVTDQLEQVTFRTPVCGYFYRLQSECTTWKVSDKEYRGSINFIVTQEVLN